MSPIYKDSPYFEIDSNVVTNDSTISATKASTDNHYTCTPNTEPSSGDVHTAHTDEVLLNESNDSNSQKSNL